MTRAARVARSGGSTAPRGALTCVRPPDRGTLLRVDPSLEAPSGDDLRALTLNFLDGDADVELVRPDGITAVPDSATDILIVENGLGTEGGKRLLRASVNPQ